MGDKQLQDLTQEINRKKKRLIALAEHHPNLTDELVLQKSRELDELINCYYHMLRNNKGR